MAHLAKHEKLRSSTESIYPKVAGKFFLMFLFEPAT
jgi:hypothetical protein